MADGVGAEDPGWRKPLRIVLPFVVLPALARRRIAADEPPILAVRTMFLAFASALFGFLVVATMLFPVTGTEPVPPVVYALVVLGPFALLALPWARRRLLGACAPPPELAAAYVTSFFLSVAFIEAAALLGFVGMFLASATWPYLVGMVVALIGFSRIAPTRERIRQLDETLTMSGCHHSLRQGLFTPTEPDPDA